MVLGRWFRRKETPDETGERLSEQSELNETESNDQAQADSEEETGKGLFARLKDGLAKTRASLVDKIDGLLSSYTAVGDEFYEELEELLIQSDVGVGTTLELVADIKAIVQSAKITDPADIKPILQDKIHDILAKNSGTIDLAKPGPTVIMVVGVNGSGKTTTIGKLAHRFKNQGLKVLLGAGDTFRAAAIEQLEVWADRVGVEIVKHNAGADPAAVAFDTIQAGKARNADVVIIDTAGRLQTKTNLMQELNKIGRVVERELGHGAQEVLLVVDATTGQNALAQAKLFSEAVHVTGVVLTKLDGTAKGGIIVAIAAELNLPVKLIGIGEAYDDLRDFDPDGFVAALFE
ncbi:MAG: signal recognition particle-docking protein FtsY [Firmicutes bacterium]|nr:signal recognition particle-docking protein FtsY [Bacillota bacterium]